MLAPQSTAVSQGCMSMQMIWQSDITKCILQNRVSQDEDDAYKCRAQAYLHMRGDKGVDWSQGIMLLILSGPQPCHHSVHLLHHATPCLTTQLQPKAIPVFSQTFVHRSSLKCSKTWWRTIMIAMCYQSGPAMHHTTSPYMDADQFCD